MVRTRSETLGGERSLPATVASWLGGVASGVREWWRREKMSEAMHANAPALHTFRNRELQPGVAATAATLLDRLDAARRPNGMVTARGTHGRYAETGDLVVGTQSSAEILVGRSGRDGRHFVTGTEVVPNPLRPGTEVDGVRIDRITELNAQTGAASDVLTVTLRTYGAPVRHPDGSVNHRGSGVRWEDIFTMSADPAGNFGPATYAATVETPTDYDFHRMTEDGAWVRMDGRDVQADLGAVVRLATTLAQEIAPPPPPAA